MWSMTLVTLKVSMNRNLDEALGLFQCYICANNVCGYRCRECIERNGSEKELSCMNILDCPRDWKCDGFKRKKKP